MRWDFTTIVGIVLLVIFGPLFILGLRDRRDRSEKPERLWNWVAGGLLALSSLLFDYVPVAIVAVMILTAMGAMWRAQMIERHRVKKRMQ